MIEGQDEKTAEKFRKLMGMRESNTNSSPLVANIAEMQKRTFDAMDKEYEMARVTTHMNRGKGLGFASAAASYLTGTGTGTSTSSGANNQHATQ